MLVKVIEMFFRYYLKNKNSKNVTLYIINDTVITNTIVENKGHLLFLSNHYDLDFCKVVNLFLKMRFAIVIMTNLKTIFKIEEIFDIRIMCSDREHTRKVYTPKHPI